MSEEKPKPDPPLTEEQKLLVATLTPQQIQAIDDALLSEVTTSWRKVARVVGFAMSTQPGWVEGVPDIYYSQRVQNLVAEGVLESAGNLAYMRFSEVRLPKQSNDMNQT